MSGVPGMPLPDWALRPCGTLAAYRRHLRRGDPVDRDCAQAVTRDWQDRAAAGYVRPRRPGVTHLAEGDGTALCGKRPRAATDDPGEATCRGCLAVLCRHLAKERARERARAA